MTAIQEFSEELLKKENMTNIYFSSVPEAIETLKLDKSKEYVDYVGNLCEKRWSYPKEGAKVSFIPVCSENGKIVKIQD
jgi:hypothetical protein